jgi:hypothetical protein
MVRWSSGAKIEKKRTDRSPVPDDQRTWPAGILHACSSFSKLGGTSGEA